MNQQETKDMYKMNEIPFPKEHINESASNLNSVNDTEK